MRFSIVTPVRNGMPWLPQAIESVALQSADVEVGHIVLDGGSTDGSREWLTEHSGGHVTLIFQPDEGQTDALARGFAAATGDTFGWLNADDILEPGTLRRVAQEFEAHPDAAIVSGSALLDEAGRARRRRDSARRDHVAVQDPPIGQVREPSDGRDPSGPEHPAQARHDTLEQSWADAAQGCVHPPIKWRVQSVARRLLRRAGAASSRS